MSTLVLSALCVVVAGLLGLLVPRVVRALPEPVESEAAPDEDPKPLYADLGARPRLALWSAVASAAVAAVVVLTVEDRFWAAALVPVVPVGVALAHVDWHTRLLPRLLVLPATAYVVVMGLAGWALSGDHSDVLRAAVGLVAARSVYWVFWFIRSAGMGFGDVRLAALLGFVLGHVGWAELVVGMYAGFLVFGLPGLLLALLRWNRSLLRRAYPFGPFMLLGALVGLLAGPAVADWFVHR